MTAQEEAALRQLNANRSASMADSARQDPRGAPRRSSGYNTSAPTQPQQPAADPYRTGPSNAEEMGGATDDPNTRIEVGPDMVPRRVPRPNDQTSMMQTFGDMMTPKGHALLNAVRETRAMRKPPTEETPTFGETGEEKRTAEAQAQEAEAQKQASIAEVQKQLKMVVDSRTGHFTPVLPGEAEPTLGRHDLLLSMASGAPEIVGRGKGVTSMAISRLMDPKRAPMQPTLNPNYKIPKQYAGIAQALGVDQPTDEEEA